MPPGGKRDFSVIVFDLDRSDENCYQEKLSFLLDIASREWFFFPKNETTLVLLNSTITQNCLKMPHIVQMEDGFMSYNPKTLRNYVESFEATVPAKGNWLDAIHVGLESLNGIISRDRGIISAQLVLITTKLIYRSDSASKVLQTIHLQNRYGIRTIIAGPSVQMGFIWNSEELERFAEEPIFPKAIEEQTREILKELCHKTKTIVCDLKVARNVFSSFKRSTRLQMWQEPLTIGTEFAIPTALARIIKEEGAITIQNEDETSSAMYYNNFVWVSTENEEQQFSFDDILPGVVRWRKFISFEDNLKEYFKVKGPRIFTLLGFADRKSVPEYLFLGCSHALGPNKNDPNGNYLVYLLYKTLLEQNKVGIARKAYALNNVPKLVALIPDEKHKMIIVNELTCADFIVGRVIENEFEKDMITGDKVNPMIERFVDEMNITSSSNLEESGFHLGPSLCFNPRSALIARRIADKYIDGVFKPLNIDVARNKSTEFEDNFPDREEDDEEVNESGELSKKEEIAEDQDYLL